MAPSGRPFLRILGALPYPQASNVKLSTEVYPAAEIVHCNHLQCSQTIAENGNLGGSSANPGFPCQLGAEIFEPASTGKCSKWMPDLGSTEPSPSFFFYANIS